MGVTSRDAKWMRKAFLMSTDGLSDQAIQEFGFTEAIARPYDTTPGGHEVLNPYPQFTRHCDIKVSTPLMKTAGMGRYHEETYGDYQQKIYLRFGVPEFTPLTQFFTGFYNYQASMLARTGRATASIAYYLGRGVGLAVTIFNIPLLITVVAFEAYRFFAGKESSKFYSFKPAMHLYWNTVSTLVNHYCVNRGIIPRVFTSDNNQESAGANNYTKEQLKRMAQVLEVFDEGGQVDMYRYASLAHRRKKKFMNRLKADMDRDDVSFSSMARTYRDVLQNGVGGPVPGRTHKEYMQMWLDSSSGKASAASGTNETTEEQTAESQVNTEDKDEKDGFWKLLKTEWDDGSAFICLRVNSTGETSTSFSNSSTKSALEDKINSAASASRSTNFSMAGGKLTGLLESTANNVRDFVGGLSDQFSVAGLAVLGGAAFVDIPEHWDTSSSSLVSQSYTMKLVSPYGNPLSQLFSMYIPMFMLLAGALPRSTGKQSYTAPFLCQLFDKGKQQDRLSIIDSLSVRRGVTNLPYNRHCQAMGMEISFSVKSLSTLMHIPISEGFSFLPTKGIFDEDTVFSDMMATMASMDLDDQIYPFRKFALNVTRWQANWRSWSSSSHMASFVGNGTPARFVSMFYKGIDP